MRKIKNTHAILMILAAFVVFSCEKDKVEVKRYGTVIGTVLDGQNDDPVPNANVTTNPPSQSVLTDGTGKFTLNSVPAGNVNITVKKKNYSTASTSVLVKGDETTDDVTIIINRGNSQTGADVKIGNPSPENESTGLPLTVDLRWQLLEDAGYDSITYDVMLYRSEDLVGKKVGSNLSDSTVVIKNLNFQTTYFWQVIAKEDDEELNRTEVWSFSTIDLPDLPFFYAKKKEGSYEIFNSDSTLNDTTAPLAQLTMDISYINWLPQVDPSRKLVAFTSNREISPYLFTVKRNGTDETRVSSRAVAGYHNQGEGFSWSPNGYYVIYGNYDNLVREVVNTNEISVLATAPAGRHFRQCHWERLSDKIVVQTMGKNIYDSEIWWMNSNGADLEMLVVNQPGRTESPTLSADAEYLMFTHDISGIDDPTGKQYDANIYLLKTDSTELINVSVNKPAGTNDLMPRFAPDNYHIIFVNQDNNATGKTGDIYITNRDGTGRRMVIENATMPYWL